jgi:hypothetical protein
MLGREIIESQQHLPLLFQAAPALSIFGGVSPQEAIEYFVGVLPASGYPVF